MVAVSSDYAKGKQRQNKGFVFFLICLFFSLTGMLHATSAKAQSSNFETRSLKIYFVQTKEHDEVVFKRNGRYVPSGLKRLNYLLRDWRRNEATNMDPRLFDVVWQIYQLSGSKSYIHVASGYRSPRTNTMLRLRSPKIAVAKNSRHTTGQAMDFYLPDVNIAYLRAIALKLQGGGIGYYPNANSPFVHVDVGTVRHWPRMSRHALVALFPKGNTMHVPTDGRPLTGYTQAVASYQQRGKTAIHAVSAHSLFGNKTRRQVILAAGDGHLPARIGRNLMGDVVPSAPSTGQAPMLAATNIPIPTFSDVVSQKRTEASDIPLPVAAPNMEVNDDEIYDIIESNSWVPPVPHSKYEETGITDDNNGLMAYAAPPSIASNGAAEALQALTEIKAVPTHKPLSANASSEDALDYQQLDVKEQALAGLAAPRPQVKPEQNDLEQLAFRSDDQEDVIQALIANSAEPQHSKKIPLPAKKAIITD